MDRFSDLRTYFEKALGTREACVSLSQAGAVVIGAGGIGCEVIRHLACAGVHQIACLDPDLVSASNLNRQLWYLPSDVGRPKVECLGEALAASSPHVQFTSMPIRVLSAQPVIEAASKIDCDAARLLVVCCADQPVGGVEVACLDAAGALQCPFFSCAMSLRRGYWALARDARGIASARDFFTSAGRIADEQKLEPLTGSASWTNAMVAALFSEILINELINARTPMQGIFSVDLDRFTREMTAAF